MILFTLENEEMRSDFFFKIVAALIQIGTKQEIQISPNFYS